MRAYPPRLSTPSWIRAARESLMRDERAAVREGHVHRLDDLVGVHLAQRAAHDGHVLRGGENAAAIDQPKAGDDRRPGAILPTGIILVSRQDGVSISVNVSGSNSISSRSQAVSRFLPCWAATSFSVPRATRQVLEIILHILGHSFLLIAALTLGPVRGGNNVATHRNDGRAH